MNQIDSAAEVTAIPYNMLKKLSGVTPKPTQRILKGPTQSTLPVKGEFTGSLRWGDQEVLQTVYVVEKLHKPLLGRPAIKALKLLLRVGTVAGERDSVLSSYFLSYLMV